MRFWILKKYRGSISIFFVGQEWTNGSRLTASPQLKEFEMERVRERVALTCAVVQHNVLSPATLECILERWIGDSRQGIMLQCFAGYLLNLQLASPIP